MKSRNSLLAVLALVVVVFGAAQLYAAVTESSTDVPKAIPDNSSTTSTLNFSVSGTITDANLTFDITHAWDSDVVVSLASPSIAIQLLVQNCGGSADNFTNTTIDEDAAAMTCAGITGAPFTGSFQSPAAGTMDAFDGSTSGGVWTLTAADDSAIITGTLNSWSLTLDGNPPLPVELMSFEIN